MLFVNLIPWNCDLPSELREFLTPEFRADMQKALEYERSPMSWCYHYSRFFEYYCYDYHHPDLQSLLCQIPILFVTTDQVGERHSIALVGREMEVTIPDHQMPYDEMTLKGLKETLELPPEREEDFDQRQINEAEEDRERNKIVCVQPILDLFGVYVSAYSHGSGSLADYEPRIFIWVDKIWNYTHKEEPDERLAVEKFHALLDQVVLHELMHALMDTRLYLDWYYLQYHPQSPFSYDTTQLYRLREESLAEALSLVLVREVVPEPMWDYLLSNTRGNSLPYRLGADYVDEELLERAVGNWMAAKNKADIFGCNSLCNPLYDDWCDYVFSGTRLDLSQLRLYEEGFWGFWFGEAHRYRESLGSTETILYTEEGLVLQVIKDYMEEHQGITRRELMEVFPSDLNDDYVTMIDYPETNGFQDKKDDKYIRSVYDDRILQCSDGQVAVCDYWSFESMPRFVKHARKLGFKIKTYPKPW
ncbi:hypothetical protein HMPREF2890_06005 [Porphyromonas sp. HMSC065F10]|nr:hypothetical protein HMPREF2890_06005 [Porphyromonas sp. HMSC065F10]